MSSLVRSDGILRVAILAPISWRVPPRAYGPWEQFASLLTEGLVRRGVDVTLFATADSVTAARLVGTAPTGYSEDPALHAKAWEGLHISAVFERAKEFDLIHNSFDFLPLTYSGLVDTPVVTTIHGFSSERILPVFEKYNAGGHYVAISDADRQDSLRYAATIYHGIDMNAFELVRRRGELSPTAPPPRRRGPCWRRSSCWGKSCPSRPPWPWVTGSRWPPRPWWSSSKRH